MGFFSSLMGGDIGEATLNALGENKDLIKGFQKQGNQIINTGETKSIGALDKAIAGYQPWVTAGSNAVGTYSDALGLNGAEGNARATGAFQTGPGYQFAMDQGTQAALRGASAAGMLSSGNTLTALTEYGQGLANQEYGSWLDRLNNLSGQGMAGASGQAAGYGAQSDVYQRGTDNRLGLENNVVQGLIGNNNQRAQVLEQQEANKGGFFGGLLNMGLSLGKSALTGGLF